MYWVTCFLLVALLYKFTILGDTIIDDKFKEVMNQLVEVDKHFINFTGANFFSDGEIFPRKKEDPPLKNIAFKNFEKGAVFSAVGQINHNYELQVKDASSTLKKIDLSFTDLLENSMEEFSAIVRKKDTVYSLLKHFCDPDVIRGKRIAGLTAILILFLSSVISTAAATGVAFAVEGFGTAEPITEEVLSKEAGINVLERQKDEMFLNVTKGKNLFVSQLADDVSNLQDVVGYLYSQVNDIQLSLKIGFAYEKIMHFLLTVLTPQNWDYEQNDFLFFVQESIAKTGLMKQGTLFGFNPIASLLMYSGIFTRILFDKETDASCSKSRIVNEFYTVQINTENVGIPTTNPVKYKIHKNKFLWISEEAFLPQTKFRPMKTISYQREILTDNSIEMHPYNNTIIMVVTSKNVVNYEIICQKLHKKGTIRTGSVISIPCQCRLSSKSLNISTYTVSLNVQQFMQ